MILHVFIGGLVFVPQKVALSVYTSMPQMVKLDRRVAPAKSTGLEDPSETHGKHMHEGGITYLY